MHEYWNLGDERRRKIKKINKERKKERKGKRKRKSVVVASYMTTVHMIDIGVSGESQHSLGFLRRTQPPRA